MVGEFLDDVFDSEDEDWNNLELYSSRGEKWILKKSCLSHWPFLYHKISPCLVLPCDILPCDILFSYLLPCDVLPCDNTMYCVKESSKHQT